MWSNNCNTGKYFQWHFSHQKCLTAWLYLLQSEDFENGVKEEFYGFVFLKIIIFFIFKMHSIFVWENLFAPWLESNCGKGNSLKELPVTGNWKAVLGFYMHQQLWLSTWIPTAWNNYIRWDHVTSLPLFWAGRKQTSGKGKRHMMVLVTPALAAYEVV